MLSLSSGLYHNYYCPILWQTSDEIQFSKHPKFLALKESLTLSVIVSVVSKPTQQHYKDYLGHNDEDIMGDQLQLSQPSEFY